MDCLTKFGVRVGTFLVRITLRRRVKTIYTIVFLIDPQGRFVLLRRADLGKGPHLDGMVGPVGGKVEPHERNIFAAAAREVREEVGVFLSRLVLKGVVFIGSPPAALFYLVGLISSVEGMIEAGREGEILVGRLEEILLGQDVPPNLPLVLEILAKRKLFIGSMRSDFEPKFPWWSVDRLTLWMISRGLVGPHPLEGYLTFP
jgi:8-oxo-dGTP pyrophosphatase MutT (NUDIX family)